MNFIKKLIQIVFTNSFFTFNKHFNFTSIRRFKFKESELQTIFWQSEFGYYLSLSNIFFLNYVHVNCLKFIHKCKIISEFLNKRKACYSRFDFIIQFHFLMIKQLDQTFL